MDPSGGGYLGLGFTYRGHYGPELGRNGTDARSKDIIGTNAAGIGLTHKQLETHGCAISIVATDALVLKHQGISTHSAEQLIIVLHQFHTKTLHLQ